MKKNIFILLAAVMLTGCGQTSDETVVDAVVLSLGTVTETLTMESEENKSVGNTTTLLEAESVTEETTVLTTSVIVTTAAENVSVGGDIEEPKSDTVTSSETSEPGMTYIDGILIVNKTYALPSDYAPGIDSFAQSAFDKMQADAAALGLNIYISSAYRSYDYQAGLYERYVAESGQAEADRFSARPGHSEHQTGLAFDLNTITDAFKDTNEGKWVAENCHKYGFIIRYPEDKESITGYKYEPWHIRYLGTDIASSVYESGLCLEEYLSITSEYAE